MADNLKTQVEEFLNQEYRWSEVEEGLNTVYRLESDRESYILKEHTNENNEVGWFRAEPEIYELLSAKTEVPSPAIVYKDFSEKEYANSFYVMEMLEGDNPENIKHDYSEEQLGNLLHQYGSILGEIHEAESFNDQYGLLSAEDGELGVIDSAEKWTWSLEGAIGSWIDIIEDKWEEPPNINSPDKNKIRNLLPEKPGSVLVHSDNRLDNLMVEGDTITGFIDWSHPRAGHGEYDLVRAEYLLIENDLEFKDEETKDKLREKLYEGYNQTSSINEEGFEERKQLYRYATTVWMAAGFANWGSTLEGEEYEKKRQDLIDRMDKEKSTIS